MPLSRYAPILVVLAYSAVVMFAFAVMDLRPPNDHDDFYLGESIDSALAYSEASWTERPGIVLQQFISGDLHPQGVPSVVVAILGTVGPSRFALRMCNLPFLLLLVVGTWLVGRELADARVGILGAFVVANLPIVLHMSRKFFVHFHAATLAPIGLYLALRLLRKQRAQQLGPWLALGLWQALRLYVHPVTLGDTFITLAGTGVVVIAMSWRNSSPLRPVLAGFGLCAGVFLLVGAPYLGLGPANLELAHSLPRYLAERGHLLETAAFSSPLAIASLLFDVLREVVWIHLFPVTAAVVLGGLCCFVGRLFRSPRSSWGAGTNRGWAVLLVAPRSCFKFPQPYSPSATWVSPPIGSCSLPRSYCSPSSVWTRQRRALHLLW